MKKIVGIGAIVKVYVEDIDEYAVYEIVSGKMDKTNQITIDSPLGRALCGHSVNDRVWVDAEEKYAVKILSIENGIEPNKEKEYRRIFFVFQGKQFEFEYFGEYIFARLEPISHWKRLRELKKGDIIIHGQGQFIRAISEVQSSCKVMPIPEYHHDAAAENYGADGLMVPTKYILLKYPLNLAFCREEIKKLQGNTEGKGYPFDKNGKGNQGYLFNLKRELAEFFISKMFKLNVFLKDVNYIQEFIGNK